MTDFKHVAVVGAGVIGASWAALFLASGRSVAVYDVSPDVERPAVDGEMMRDLLIVGE